MPTEPKQDRNVECRHDRLTEEGQCRSCGADCRQSPAPQPQGDAKAIVPTKEEREVHYRYASERPALPAAELVLKYIAALEHVEGERNLKAGLLVDAQAERDALSRFKGFVHAYLDQHGIPEGDPDNQHQKEGCRIGARLDLVFAERDALREENTRLKGRAGLLDNGQDMGKADEGGEE